MGCRAFLSPWYERGGMEPADENDTPVFVGRFNIGAVSLHLPMILAKARAESRDFYEVLDEYLEMIRRLHIRTYDYLGEMRASTNPLGYCEGGFYGGHLKPGEKIKKLLKPMTASFGITALNELQELYNGKSIREDGEFALEVMRYINKKINEYKEEDGILYAIYGTPAESLCGLQIEQFRKKYGIVENVSDRPYVSNSFHCHVTEEMTPIEKQDKEGRFWELCNGGKIQYVRYPVGYNKEAVKEYQRLSGIQIRMTYPSELNKKEMEQLELLNADLFLYGYQPLMVSAQCVKNNLRGCDKTPSWLTLKDRYNANFFVHTSCCDCINEIYNGKPLWVGNEAGILNDLHPSVIRFHITRENEVQVKEILNAAKSIQKGERASLATEYTTGHLKREVL